MLENLSFIFFALLVLGLFSLAVLSHNLLYSLASLAGGMVFLSGLYFLLDAEFLGVIQLIVYSGAVLGIYGFAMIFFDANKKLREKLPHKNTLLLIALAGAGLLGGLFVNFHYQGAASSLPIMDAPEPNKQLALALFSKYLLAFEFIAVLLLIALLAAIVLTQREVKK